MPLTRRQFLAALGVTAAGATLPGCGSATPVATTGPVLAGAYDGPPVTIEYWNGFTGGDGPAMRQLVADYNASQDLVTVRMNVVQWAQYYQRVIAAVHAGKGPDVGAMHVEQLATQAARQTISPIDEVVTELGLSAQLYPTDVWEAGNYNGSRYGVPFDVHSLGSYANLALLDQAGIAEQPATGDDLDSANEALLDAGIEGPFWMPNRWPAHLMFLSLLWQFGGEPYAEDGSAAMFGSDAGVEALSWMAAQVEQGFSPPNVAPGLPVHRVQEQRGRVHLGRDLADQRPPEQCARPPVEPGAHPDDRVGAGRVGELAPAGDVPQSSTRRQQAVGEQGFHSVPHRELRGLDGRRHDPRPLRRPRDSGVPRQPAGRGGRGNRCDAVPPTGRRGR